MQIKSSTKLRNEYGVMVKCINAGMDDYITKPIDIIKLKEMIDKWTI